MWLDTIILITSCRGERRKKKEEKEKDEDEEKATEGDEKENKEDDLGGFQTVDEVNNKKSIGYRLNWNMSMTCL